MSIHVCEACGKPIPDDAAVCPYCGAEQQRDIRLTRIPETIEELRDFCAAHQMPLQKMRFFIGEDYRGAKAFGIYKDEAGNCVVYKNKADGSRAVRYEGPDEKHAVRELYEKLKSETELRRGAPALGAASRSGGEASDKPMKPWELFVGAIFALWKPILIVIAVVLVVRWTIHTPDKGYYRYKDDTYYYQDHEWYYYNPALDTWDFAYDVPELLDKNYDDYYESEEYRSDYGAEDFSRTTYYREDRSYDSDSSYDDYDWDSGSDSWDSWDSGSTDWDSDW